MQNIFMGNWDQCRGFFFYKQDIFLFYNRILFCFCERYLIVTNVRNGRIYFRFNLIKFFCGLIVRAIYIYLFFSSTITISWPLKRLISLNNIVLIAVLGSSNSILMGGSGFFFSSRSWTWRVFFFRLQYSTFYLQLQNIGYLICWIWVFF